MGFVYNSMMSTRVNRLGIDELVAETTLLTTDLEAVSWVTTDVKGLTIKDCRYVLYREGQGNITEYNFPGLIGVEAYLNAGPDLKRVLGSPQYVIARELIAECIRGLVQSETYFFKERGMADAAQYDAVWTELYADSCRFYSHLDRVQNTWMEYAGEDNRQDNLFNRSKNVMVHKTENGGRVINGFFIDSFHELALQLTLNEQGVITAIEGNFLRAPGKICWENREHLPKFLGHKLQNMSKRDIAALAGGSEGCNHLVDLLYETVRAADKTEVIS